MTIIRCNADGSRDTAFGVGGTFPNLGRFGSGTSVVIQPDGKIVVLGSSQGSFTSPALPYHFPVQFKWPVGYNF